MPTTNHPIVGKVRWTAQSEPKGTIRLADGWEAENIVTVEVPALVGVDSYGRKFGGKVRFYRGAADQLQAAWAEVKAQGLMDRVLSWDGSFVPRMIRGSLTKPSEHTFGCAFDINVQWNGLGVTPPRSGLRGSVRELVPIFEKHGFLWGGGWARRPDGMHFQIERLGTLPAKQEEAPPSIAVFVDGLQQVVPALLIEGRTWIGARALAKRLNGRIVSVGADPFEIEMELKGQTKAFEGLNEGGVGYVAFSDVMPLYGLPFTFDNKALRIDISTR